MRYVLVIFTSMCFLFSGSLFAVESTGEILSSQKGAGQPLDTPHKSVSPKKDKINDFLKIIETAKNFDQISKSFKKAQFNQTDLKKLEDKIKKPPYSTKLDRMKSDLARKSKSDKRRKMTSKKKGVKQMNMRLRQSQKTVLASHNRAASNFLVHARQNSVSAQRTVAAASRAIQVPQNILARATTVIPQSDVEITDISPSVGLIGDARGQVSIAIADPGNRAAYYGSIREWTNNRIEFTIPLDFENHVEFDSSGRFSGSGERTYLCVFPAGNVPGNCTEFTIALDPDRFRPTISSMSSTEVRPGQRFAFSGTNLAPGGRYPEIVFYFGGHRIYEFDIEEITDTYISLMIPDHIEGWVEMPGRVEVRTVLGHTIERDVTFIPLEELVEIRSDAMQAFCSPWHPRIFCWAGEINQFTQHNWTLRNGWKVETSWLETTDHGPNAGAYYVQQPGPGSIAAVSIIDVWADAFSTATCYEVFVIKGPKGTVGRCR